MRGDNEGLGGVGGSMDGHAGDNVVEQFLIPQADNTNPPLRSEQKHEHSAGPAAGDETGDAYHGGYTNGTAGMPILDNANGGNQSAEGPAGLDGSLKSADQDISPAWPCDMSDNNTVARQDSVIRDSSSAESPAFAVCLNREPDNVREEELEGIVRRIGPIPGNRQADSEPLFFYGRSLSLSSEEDSSTPPRSADNHNRPRSK